MNEKIIILSENQIGFVRHFIESYHKNFSKGNLDEANHDAVAVVLYLSDIPGVLKEDLCP